MSVQHGTDDSCAGEQNVPTSPPMHEKVGVKRVTFEVKTKVKKGELKKSVRSHRPPTSYQGILVHYKSHARPGG